MPYINPKARWLLEDYPIPGSPGELNYLLTQQVLDYLRIRGESYQTYCEIEGVLGHIGKELYRRRVAPYEEEKIKENGDVEGFSRG